jgi:N-acetyl-anhydromuramyl-L-alanine amidase AmpD
MLYMRLNKGAVQQTPDTIVIHAMSEYIEEFHAVDFLKNIGLSVHAMITPDGKTIKCRNDNEGAYHAKEFNTNSLGVEFLVKGQHTYTTFLAAIQNNYISDEQYKAGVKLVRHWLAKHNIIQVATHKSLSPGRKFDPGPGFPLKQFEKDIGIKIK